MNVVVGILPNDSDRHQTDWKKKIINRLPVAHFKEIIQILVRVKSTSFLVKKNIFHKISRAIRPFYEAVIRRDVDHTTWHTTK